MEVNFISHHSVPLVRVDSINWKCKDIWVHTLNYCLYDTNIDLCVLWAMSCITDWVWHSRGRQYDDSQGLFCMFWFWSRRWNHIICRVITTCFSAYSSINGLVCLNSAYWNAYITRFDVRHIECFVQWLTPRWKGVLISFLPFFFLFF